MTGDSPVACMSGLKGFVMHNYSSILVVTGSLCLLITLGLAWCLVGVRSSSFMKRLFPNYQNLLKAHLDYLMMTGLLMIFFLLFNQFRVLPSPLVVFAMCVGSFMNPVGFIALAIKPDFRQQPASPFGAVMAGSFSPHVPGLSPPAFSRLAFSRSGSTAPANCAPVGMRGALLCAVSRFSKLARLRLSVARGVYRL